MKKAALTIGGVTLLALIAAVVKCVLEHLPGGTP